MTVLHRTATLLPLLLGLAACQVTRMPDGRLGLGPAGASYSSSGGVETTHMRTPYPIVPGLNFTTDKDARAVAAVLVQAYDTHGGMPDVAADVRRCYAFADADLARNSSWPSEYRFCILYDGVAYRTDNTRARDHGLPRTPYFDPVVAANRWSRHIIDAGQGRQSELDTFMMKGAALTGRYLPARLFTSPG